MNRLIYLIKKFFIDDKESTDNVILENMSKKELISYFESNGIIVDKRYKAETIIKKYKDFI